MAKEYLSANPPYVVIQKGDTLSEIAEKYGSYISGSGIYGSGGKLETLAKINNISNVNRVAIGETIKLSGSAATTKTNTSNKVNVQRFGLQSDTDRTMFITWTWDKTNTDHYQVKWWYDTGDSVWFVGSDGNETEKQSVYNAPSNAIKVKVQIKPVAKTHKVNNKDVAYWTAEWSTAKTHTFDKEPPETPSAPSVKLDDYKLTVTLNGIPETTTKMQFQIIKNETSIYKTQNVKITSDHRNLDQVIFSYTVAADGEYKVRCRAWNTASASEWSGYSSSVVPIPAATSGITVCRASSKTSVYLEWAAEKTAKRYDIEYSTKIDNFDKNDQTTIVSDIEFTYREITGLESGNEYFFRVRSVNDTGESKWSSIKSVVIGTAPESPTTWSSTTTARVGESVTLYWVHNSKDGSREKSAQISYTIEDTFGTVIDTQTVVQTKNTPDDEEETTSYYVINTTGAQYSEGAKILWQVKTKGVTDDYSEWSVQRTIDIHAQPTMQLNITDKAGDSLDEIPSLPFYLSIVTGPKSQVPIGYHVSIVSNDQYFDTDEMGNEVRVFKGDEIYSKHFDVTPNLIDDEYYEVVIKLSADNISLRNNKDYTAHVTVSTNSGLVEDGYIDFSVAWEDQEYVPNAEITLHPEEAAAAITVYCKDENSEYIRDVVMSLYRREVDGTFTELMKDVGNGTFMSDPKVSLDYARYRIVAKSETTGQITYYDMPAYPMGITSIVIQWEEKWTPLNNPYDDPPDDSEEDIVDFTETTLKLPYNVDISDEYDPEVTIVKYIGRENPTAYYGTQLGFTSTWSADIDKNDEDTLYALRRLARYMGDVYVREPSGTGYWANVKVSYPKKHNEVTIPVTLNVTRVERSE